jgi:hypothetical protein
MIIFNLDEAGKFKTPDGSDSMYVELWHDASEDFFTFDQRDEFRFDVWCMERQANLQMTNLPGKP